MHRAAGLSGSGTAQAAPAPAIDWVGERPSNGESEAHRRVCAAFEQAVADALEHAAAVDADPERAVHEFRRATRRARAAFALVRRSLPTTTRIEIAAALQSVLRDTCVLRDRDVLPAALARLEPRRGTEEARAQVASQLLADRIRARRPRSRARVLAVAASRLGLLPDRLAIDLPASLSFGDLDEGLARLARRARRAVRSARRDPDSHEHSHEARKRIRLLALALSGLPGEAPAAERVARRLARLSTRLGDTLDLELLAQYARGTGVPPRVSRRTARGYRRLLEQLDRDPHRVRRKLLAGAGRLLAKRRLRAILTLR
jgi:CHAD domain-containing protein